MTPGDMKIIVVEHGFQGKWGKADTLDEALKNAKRPRYYRAYIVHPGSTVCDDGALRSPDGFKPKMIVEKLFKPKKAKPQKV